MGDDIDCNEWKNGKREEGVVYAFQSFFCELARGIGSAPVLAFMNEALDACYAKG